MPAMRTVRTVITARGGGRSLAAVTAVTLRRGRRRVLGGEGGLRTQAQRVQRDDELNDGNRDDLVSETQRRAPLRNLQTLPNRVRTRSRHRRTPATAHALRTRVPTVQEFCAPGWAAEREWGRFRQGVRHPRLLAVSLGLSALYPDDHEMLRRGLVVYDALYHGQVADSVREQLELFAQLKSVWEDRQIWYCVVDGDDTSRLVAAYSAQFRGRR
jgi:hypothetical protein